MERREATKLLQHHWNYFIAIEQDVSRLSRFIEFDERNYCAFSIEMARVLMISSAEIDVIMKMYCKELCSTSNPGNITDYQAVIERESPDFFMSYVKMPRYGIESFIPWKSWKDAISPEWWKANNDVKHHREEHFNKANLKNTLYSVVGLFALLNCFMRVLEEKHQISIAYLEASHLFVYMGSCDP